VASLRQQTAQLCEEMLESMRTGKTGVHQKTLNRLTRFIEEFIAAPRAGVVYNLGGGKQNAVSILESFSMVEAITGKKMV
jgi:nucleoside-diphosphate-sugar epimerase